MAGTVRLMLVHGQQAQQGKQTDLTQNKDEVLKGQGIYCLSFLNDYHQGPLCSSQLLRRFLVVIFLSRAATLTTELLYRERTSQNKSCRIVERERPAVGHCNILCWL